MGIVIVTPVRLLGEGLALSLGKEPNFNTVHIVSDVLEMQQVLKCNAIELALIDVTLSVDLDAIRSVAAACPQVALVALGLNEQRSEIIRCGRAGFCGYVARDADLETLCKTLRDVLAGRLACSAEISGGLLRALFHGVGPSDDQRPPTESSLTRREQEIFKFVSGGLSNKEIARELSLSVATVKHHVHHILEKFNVQRRAQAIHKARDVTFCAPTRQRRAGQ